VLLAAWWLLDTWLGVALALTLFVVGSGFVHEVVRRVMTGSRWSRQTPQIGNRTIKQLTQGEREACESLIGLYRCRDLLPELRDRLFPLLCGPSGAGKTTTVRAAVDEIFRLHHDLYPSGAVTYLELHATSWIPAGALAPATLSVISDAINALAMNKHGLLIIFLDELDKLRNTTRANGNSAWHMSGMQEIQALLGRSVGILRWRWAHTLSPMFRRVQPATVLRQAYLIGAGAFQDVYQSASGTFRLEALGHDRHPEQFAFEAHSQRLPFNGDDFQLYSRAQWILLPPPSTDDLRRAARVMIAGPLRWQLEGQLERFVSTAAATQIPLRTLEEVIMRECVRITKTEAPRQGNRRATGAPAPAEKLAGARRAEWVGAR